MDLKKMTREGDKKGLQCSLNSPARVSSMMNYLFSLKLKRLAYCKWSAKAAKLSMDWLEVEKLMVRSIVNLWP